VLLLAACTSRGPVTEQTLGQFPVDDLSGLITQTGVALDAANSTDGNGSLRIEATAPTVVYLYEVHDIDLDNATLFYRARVKTEGLEGQAYLEMWCHFPGGGEYFSRGLQSPVSGTQGWTTAETPFLLRQGENPDYVKLNLVIDGTGTAWIDDIRLLGASM